MFTAVPVVAIIFALAIDNCEAGQLYGLQGVPDGGLHFDHATEYAPTYDNYKPRDYHFNYAVSDPHTGDHKSQWEVKENGVVRGGYSLLEPDGTTRIVEYVADEHGFRAVVKKIGHSVHPQVETHGVAPPVPPQLPLVPSYQSYDGNAANYIAKPEPILVESPKEIPLVLPTADEHQYQQYGLGYQEAPVLQYPQVLQYQHQPLELKPAPVPLNKYAEAIPQAEAVPISISKYESIPHAIALPKIPAEHLLQYHQAPVELKAVPDKYVQYHGLSDVASAYTTDYLSDSSHRIDNAVPIPNDQHLRLLFTTFTDKAWR